METWMRCWVLLLGLSLPGAFAAVAMAADTRPLAVLIYADWCYNCKMIKPRLAVLEAEYGDRIRFDRLDVSSDETKSGARKKAADLGILPLYFNNKGTGLVMLINTRREKIGELRHTLGDQEMRAALDALIAP